MHTNLLQILCLMLVAGVASHPRISWSQDDSVEELVVTISEADLQISYPAGGKLGDQIRTIIDPVVNGRAAWVIANIDYGRVRISDVLIHMPEAWAAFDSAAVIARFGPEAFEGSGDYVDFYTPDSYDLLRQAMADSTSLALPVHEAVFEYEYVQAGSRGYLVHCGGYLGSYMAPAITFVGEYMVVVEALPREECAESREKHLELLSQLRIRNLSKDADRNR